MITPKPSPTAAFLMSAHEKAEQIVQSPENFGMSALSLQKGKQFRNGITASLNRALDLAYIAWNAEYTLHDEEGNQHERYETYTHRLETAIERFGNKFYTDKHLITFSMVSTLIDKNEKRKDMFNGPEKGQNMKDFIDKLFYVLDHPFDLIETLVNEHLEKERNEPDVNTPKTPPAETASILKFPR